MKHWRNPYSRHVMLNRHRRIFFLTPDLYTWDLGQTVASSILFYEKYLDEQWQNSASNRISFAGKLDQTWQKIPLKHVVNWCRQGLFTKLFHNIPNPKVARFLGFIQGFHGQIVDANTVLDVFWRALSADNMPPWGPEIESHAVSKSKYCSNML